MKKTATVLALIALGTAAFAHGGVTNKDVMARMMVMGTISEQMKVIGSMAKGETDFDADVANAALIEIAAQSAQVPSMFETPATDPKSEALPVIWEQWDSFAARAQDAEAAAERLAGTVVAQSDLGPVLRQVGETCKACHSTFRE
ncbi:MAG: c-type cytochrome [Salipiger thiooxidans]|jgi:cytochrome c556|uniref:c-type cytochrome n=1 Tax=Salipiger thiooxidans TaxID=282683 RepID=UPI001A8ED95E|nr:cytochrome c [Salipiger thiooxidans]MBN8189043.1 cytochrome c [Salipiger thiooxidans]MBR9839059.1 cytochrome c [Paracoccaceae bacterium]MCA0849150.1 cytochrome c [Salipiger thiooxidans]